MTEPFYRYNLTNNSWLGRVDIFQTFQTVISDETYEELRQILEKQNGYEYTLEQAKEIGDGLVDFFIILLKLSNNDSLR